jgi:hypothetical protein
LLSLGARQLQRCLRSTGPCHNFSLPYLRDELTAADTRYIAIFDPRSAGYVPAGNAIAIHQGVKADEGHDRVYVRFVEGGLPDGWPTLFSEMFELPPPETFGPGMGAATSVLSRSLGFRSEDVTYFYPDGGS